MEHVKMPYVRAQRLDHLAVTLPRCFEAGTEWTVSAAVAQGNGLAHTFEKDTGFERGNPEHRTSWCHAPILPDPAQRSSCNNWLRHEVWWELADSDGWLRGLGRLMWLNNAAGSRRTGALTEMTGYPHQAEYFRPVYIC